MTWSNLFTTQNRKKNPSTIIFRTIENITSKFTETTCKKFTFIYLKLVELLNH